MINKRYSITIQQVLLFVLLLSFALSACTKQAATPTFPLHDKIDTTAKLQLQGKFVNGPFGLITGEAKIYTENGKFTLLPNNIDVSNGPDLHVYLSKELNPKSFTKIYGLQNALIHCQQFDHLFGSAELQ